MFLINEMACLQEKNQQHHLLPCLPQTFANHLGRVRCEHGGRLHRRTTEKSFLAATQKAMNPSMLPHPASGSPHPPKQSHSISQNSRAQGNRKIKQTTESFIMKVEIPRLHAWSLNGILISP